MLEGIFLQYLLDLLEFLEGTLTILWELPLTELPYSLSVMSLQQFVKCSSGSFLGLGLGGPPVLGCLLW